MAGHQSPEYGVTTRIWHFESKLRAGELLTVGPREASKPNKNRSYGSYTLSSRLKAVREQIVELWSHDKRVKCVVLFSARHLWQNYLLDTSCTSIACCECVARQVHGLAWYAIVTMLSILLYGVTRAAAPVGVAETTAVKALTQRPC